MITIFAGFPLINPLSDLLYAVGAGLVAASIIMVVLPYTGRYAGGGDSFEDLLRLSREGVKSIAYLKGAEAWEQLGHLAESTIRRSSVVRIFADSPAALGKILFSSGLAGGKGRQNVAVLVRDAQARASGGEVRYLADTLERTTGGSDAMRLVFEDFGSTVIVTDDSLVALINLGESEDEIYLLLSADVRSEIHASYLSRFKRQWDRSRAYKPYEDV